MKSSLAVFVAVLILVTAAIGYVSIQAPRYTPPQTWATTTASSNTGGLSLQISMNETGFPAGGALSAVVRLVNTLNRSLSPTVGPSPEGSTLNQWAGNASLCGLAFTGVFGAFGYAVFNGTYDADNFRQATTPLLIGVPVATSCPSVPPYPGLLQQIVFKPKSQVTAATYDDRLFTRSMQLNITTGGCSATTYTVIGGTEYFNSTTSTYGRSVNLTVGCGMGSSLDGYWTRPYGGTGNFSIDDRSNATITADLNELYHDYFHPFPAGSYTIVAEDVWNQTVFAHFSVLNTGCDFASVTSEDATVLSHQYGSVYCAGLNGTAYYADFVSPEITFQNSGVGRFTNGSISFRGVNFEIQVKNQTALSPPDVEVNMSFPDGTSYAVEVAYGTTPFGFAVQHIDPTAGVLVTGGGCPILPAYCPPYLIYLLVSP